MYTTLYDELSRLKRENQQLKTENETMRNLINSYYQEDKHDLRKFMKNKKQLELSDGAKQFVRDIARQIDWRENNDTM